MEKELLVFAEALKKICAANIKSFVVYGSAASGEKHAKSDFNTLLVLKTMTPADLKAISKIVEKWVNKGNPAPLLFTYASLLSSTDTFPLEFTDIKENHLTLAGEEIFNSLKIIGAHLRNQLEREIKIKTLKLREGYLLANGNSGKLKNIMKVSISTFLAIFKGLLRLTGEQGPLKKSTIIEKASKKMRLNAAIFFAILHLKEGSDKIKNKDTEIFYGQYLVEIEKAGKFIDNFTKKNRRK
ncbi:MAG: hypothetical protein WCJ46_05215 [bacterium]